MQCSTVLRNPLEPKPYFSMAAGVAVFWVATGDLVRTVGLGGVSTVITLFILGAVALMPLHSGSHSLGRASLLPPARVPISGPLFVAWTITSFLFIGRFPAASQNLAVYLSFILAMYCGTRTSSLKSGEAILRAFRAASLLSTLLWLPTVFTTGLGTDGILVTRGSAAYCSMFGLVAAVALPVRKWIDRLSPYYFACIPLLTLSRFPLILGALVVIGIGLRSRKPLLSTVTRGLLVTIVARIVFSVYLPLQDRFSNNDGSSLAGIQVGTSGRTTIWDVLLNATSRTTNLFGAGAGASEHIVVGEFGRISQPHNDYLRMFVDFGWVGLTLFVFMLFVMILGSLKRWLHARRTDQSPIHFAALILAVVTAAYAYLDNVMVYSFFMTPVGIVIGTSLATGRYERELQNP